MMRSGRDGFAGGPRLKRADERIIDGHAATATDYSDLINFVCAAIAHARGEPRGCFKVVYRNHPQQAQACARNFTADSPTKQLGPGNLRFGDPSPVELNS
jgi:hypothetical protein